MSVYSSKGFSEKPTMAPARQGHPSYGTGARAVPSSQALASHRKVRACFQAVEDRGADVHYSCMKQLQLSQPASYWSSVVCSAH